MRKQKEIALSDDRQEVSETQIKTITHKVNERLDFIFNGKVKDLQALREKVIYKPTALSIRVWTDIEKRYPGLRDLLLNSQN